MAQKLTDQEIRALLDEEIRGAAGYSSSELSSQRRTALEYYYGEPFGNESEGRSSYVSRDVADTIEWIMPSLMRIFTGGDTIVRFEPQGPEDEQKAQQATDYINYVFQRQNDGFLTLYTWFKDALLSKNGFVKVYWEKYTEYKTESYENLSDDEFAMLLQDDEVEPLEHSEDAIVDPLSGMVSKVHSLKVRKKTETGKCCIDPIPPEEVLVNRYPVAPLNRNRFVCHRRRVSVSEIVEMGLMSKEEAESLPSYDDEDFNEERTSRYSFDETDSGDNPTNKGSRFVWLAEAYIKLDVDGDGVAELRKITMAGDRILENEEIDTLPFVTLTPIILPHKLYGMSVADLVMDLQLLKSTVFRQILDNMYLANNGRYMALDGMVNIDDLLTSRPGGIVRVKTFDAVKPMQPPLLGAPAFNLLEYIDLIKENRTGVNRAPLDPDSISKTATGANIHFQGAQARIELIARVFAETGVKDLFYAILENVQKYQDESKVIRLRNEWIQMDPREWTAKFDLSVTVGLGTGSKESQLMALNEETQYQAGALQAGIPIVTPENIYNLRMKALEAKNIKGGDLFYTHPSKMPPPPPQQNPDAIKLELEQMKGQNKAQLQEMKAQQDMMKQEQKSAHDRQKTELQGMIDAALQEKQNRAQLQGQAMQQQGAAQINRENIRAQAEEGDKSRRQEVQNKVVDLVAGVAQEERKQANDEKSAEIQAILQMMQDNTKAQNDVILKMVEASLAERETEVSERDSKGKVKKTVSRVKKNKENV
jgi:hypothetical protein